MTNQEITSKLKEKKLTVGITINTEFVKDAIEDVKVFGYKYWESNTAAGPKMKELIKSLSL